MIHHALNLLRSELDAYIVKLSEEEIVVANVAAIEPNDTGDGQLTKRVIISLVNIEEESAFKNLPNATKTLTGGVRYENPPVFLNLYLLFSANFPITNYDRALQLLSEVIRFFQGKRVFNLRNAPGFESGTIPPPPELVDMQLILDLYTMTFEQINHLWGSLGGKQIPFVMYKARLVRVQDRRTTGAGALIEELGSELRSKT